MEEWTEWRHVLRHIVENNRLSNLFCPKLKNSIHNNVKVVADYLQPDLKANT